MEEGACRPSNYACILQKGWVGADKYEPADTRETDSLTLFERYSKVFRTRGVERARVLSRVTEEMVISLKPGTGQEAWSAIGSDIRSRVAIGEQAPWSSGVHTRFP